MTNGMKDNEQVVSELYAMLSRQVRARAAKRPDMSHLCSKDCFSLTSWVLAGSCANLQTDPVIVGSGCESSSSRQQLRGTREKLQGTPREEGDDGTGQLEFLDVISVDIVTSWTTRFLKVTPEAEDRVPTLRVTCEKGLASYCRVWSEMVALSQITIKNTRIWLGDSGTLSGLLLVGQCPRHGNM